MGAENESWGPAVGVEELRSAAVALKRAQRRLRRCRPGDLVATGLTPLSAYGEQIRERAKQQEDKDMSELDDIEAQVATLQDDSARLALEEARVWHQVTTQRLARALEVLREEQEENRVAAQAASHRAAMHHAEIECAEKRIQALRDAGEATENESTLWRARVSRCVRALSELPPTRGEE